MSSSSIKKYNARNNFVISKFDKKNDIVTLSNIDGDDNPSMINNIRITVNTLYTILNSKEDGSVHSLVYKAISDLSSNKKSQFTKLVSMLIVYDIIYKGEVDNPIGIKIISITVNIKDALFSSMFNMRSVMYVRTGDVSVYKAALYNIKPTFISLIGVSIRNASKNTNVPLRKRCIMFNSMCNKLKSSQSRISDILLFECVSLFMACIIYKILDRNGLVRNITKYYIDNIKYDDPGFYNPDGSILNVVKTETELNKNEINLFSNVSVYMMKRIDDLLYKSQVMDHVSFCKIPLPRLMPSGIESDDEYSSFIDIYNNTMKRIITASNSF